MELDVYGSPGETVILPYNVTKGEDAPIFGPADDISPEYTGWMLSYVSFA